MSVISVIGNTKKYAVSLGMTEDIMISFEPSVTKSVKVTCDTYMDTTFVSERTFNSDYTEGHGDIPSSNNLLFTFDPTYSNMACFLSTRPVDFKISNHLPAGTSLSYTLYQDYATPATETEMAKVGGVEIQFQSDKAMSKTADNSFGVSLLSPFATFISKEGATCTVNPPVDNISFKNDGSNILVLGTFEANQQYIITCPDTKISSQYVNSKYSLSSSFYFNDIENSCSDYPCRGDLQSMNAASFSTIIGFAIVVASALAALL